MRDNELILVAEEQKKEKIYIKWQQRADGGYTAGLHVCFLLLTTAT